MNILLINFHYTIEDDPSLTLKNLSAITQDDHIVKISNGKDFDNSNIADYDKYDIIGMTVSTNFALKSYEIADEFRKRGKKVVLGGWHVSALPNEAKQHADSVVIGEAEKTWPALIKDCEEDNLKTFYKNEEPLDLRNMPILSDPDRVGVEASRGCPHGCMFCSISNSYEGNVYRKRSIEDIVEEIKTIKKDNFAFYDSSLTIDMDFTKKLFMKLKEVDKNFSASGNIDLLGKNEEFLKLASEAGCLGWCIGFESASQKNIDTMGKKTNTVKKYKSIIKKIHEYGMYVIGNFIFGFDYDTEDIFKNTVDFVDTIELDIPDIFILTPFPGTPLFNILESEGRILTRDWSKYDFGHVVFKPKLLDPEVLLENSKITFKKLYSWPKIIKRTYRSRKLNSSSFDYAIKLTKRFRGYALESQF
jgi:radical SAM superfamily enzyme YgiQ (UPF0313 family)